MENLKISLETVINSAQSFADFCRHKHRATVAYRLAKVLKALTEAVKAYEEQVTAAKIKYGESVMDGDTPAVDQAGNALLKFTPEVVKKLNDEIAELLKTEIVELPMTEKIKVTLKDLEDLKINPSAFEMQAAEHFVEFA